MSFIGVSYRSIGDMLLIGAEMIQRLLHNQNLPQHGWQLIKAENLGLSAQLVGRLENSSSKEVYCLVLCLWQKDIYSPLPKNGDTSLHFPQFYSSFSSCSSSSLFIRHSSFPLLHLFFLPVFFLLPVLPFISLFPFFSSPFLLPHLLLCPSPSYSSCPFLSFPPISFLFL